MSFKDMVENDNHNVFLNLDEFAERRIIIYDGVTYDGAEHMGIQVVLTGLKEKNRRQLQSDHAQGLYLVSSVLYCDVSDFEGNQPEKGMRIKISDGNSGFFREFYIASSVCNMGMLRIELEEICE